MEPRRLTVSTSRSIIVRAAGFIPRARRKVISRGRRNSGFQTVCGFLLSVIVAASWTPAAPGADESPHPPTIHLSTGIFPAEVADEQAYTMWLADRAQQLMEAAGTAEESKQRIKLRLAAINWVLASQCEPPMSRRLQHIGTPHDRELVKELTRQGLKELEVVRAELERFTAPLEHDQDAADGFESSIELLASFAEALHACVTQASEPDAGTIYRKAALKLSVYLEDDRRQVAAAARLWQGVLYGKAERIDRSLRLLPLPSEPTGHHALRYDFFARLLRCRHLARRQAFAAAWSLLLTLEERSQEWFVTLRSRSEAGRATALARLELCTGWSNHREGPSRQATKAWCDELTAQMRDTYLPPDGEHSVTRLAAAAPTIMEIPDLDAAADTSTGQVPDTSTEPQPTPEVGAKPEDQSAPQEGSQNGDAAEQAPQPTDEPPQ
ncbi:MAG: hypothetical protein V3W34_03020 [Phycisphaerae bacterium]